MNSTRSTTSTQSRPRLSRGKLALAIAGLLSTGVGPAFAANCTWLPASGNWNAGGNWSCGIVPTGPALDTANIGSGKLSTINATSSIFTLNNAGQLNIDAFLLTLQSAGSTRNSGIINVGGPSTAALQMFHAIDNTDGIINISSGSALNQFAGVITNGTITTSGTGALVAFSNSSNVLSGVTLNGRLDLASTANSRERIANGLALNGAVNVANGGILSLDGSLTAGGSQTIGDTGVINLNDAGARLAIEGAGTTTLGAGITVRGQGNIGQAAFAAGNHTLVNNGQIVADVDGGTLDLVDPANGGGSLTNNGILKATNGGTLRLFTDVTASAASQIVAEADSQIVQNGVRIAGTLNVSGPGLFSANSSASNVLDGVTLNGVLDLATIANARERVINGLSLNGSINVGSSGILSLDRSLSSADHTVSGSGTINLNGPGARLAIEGAGTTTLGANITVRGQGNLGQAAFAAGNHTLVNNGLIVADVDGGTLDIVNPANGGGSSLSNSGTLKATNGGTLRLSTNVTASATSQIVAEADSRVVQNGVRITGAVNTSGSGLFAAASSGSNVFNGVTLNGTLDLSSIANSRERIANGLTLNGAINVANGGVLSLDSSLTAGGNQTIGGTGVINLNDAGARLAIEGAGTTTLGAGITVRGQGNIGQALFVAGNNTLVNNGLIVADVDGGTLDIVNPANGGGSSLSNNGTLKATNGGTLRLFTDVTASAASQIIAEADSRVVQNGVRITGAVNSSGSGLFAATSSGSNVFNGVTLNGTLDLSSITNSRERIANGLTLNGAINVANGGILSLDSSLTAGGNQTIGGTGVINLNDAGARLAIEGAGTTTLGAGITVRGEGNLGQAAFVAGNHTLVNNGLIVADVNGGTLDIVNPANGGGSSLSNNGTLKATNGGTLRLSTDVTAGAASQIVAEADSRVVQNGVRITGAVNTSGSGLFAAASSSRNVFDAVTLNGTLDLSSITNSRERIANGLTLNGAINVANGGILSLDSSLTAGGNQTIGGTGVINLNDAGARLAIEGAGTTTLGAGITVRGEGNLGQAAFVAGNHTLVNEGKIAADVRGRTLSLVAPANGGGSAINNRGEIEAHNGATLAVFTSLHNAAKGTLTAGAGSLLNLQTNAFSNSGLIQGDGFIQTLSAATVLVNAGTLAPGVGSIGTLTLTGGYSQTSSGALDIDIGSLSSFDLFRIDGKAALDGTLNLTCSRACSMAVGDEITILDANDNGLSGAFASLALSGFASGRFDVLYDVANGDVKLRVTEAVSAVPLPAGVWLMLSGLGAIGAIRRRAG